MAAPVLPLRGDDAARLLAEVGPVFEEFGFDLPVTMTMLNERSMVAVLNISFDKSAEGEAERARKCYEIVNEKLLALGFVPYRCSLAGMKHIVSPPTYSGRWRASSRPRWTPPTFFRRAATFQSEPSTL